MSKKFIKHPVSLVIETPIHEINDNITRLTNAPTTNNSNNSLISRNSVTGNLEIVSKSTITGGTITMSNPGSATPGVVPILLSPGINTPLPGPFNFSGLIAGPGISLAFGGNNITISSSNNLNIYNSDGTTINNIRTVTVTKTLLFDYLTASGTFEVNNPNIIMLKTNLNGGVTIYGDNSASMSSRLNVELQCTDSLANINIGTTTGINSINIGSPANYNNSLTLAGDDILIYSGTILRFVTIPDINTDYVLHYNIGSKEVSYHAVENFYGYLLFSSQTTQSFTSTTPVQSIITSASLGTPFSAGITLAGTSDGIQYGGSSNKDFEISFVCNISPTVTGQTIIMSLFVNGIEIVNSRNSQFVANNPTNMSTRPVITTLATGDIIRTGFARSTTNTTIVFSGSIFLKSLN